MKKTTAATIVLLLTITFVCDFAFAQRKASGTFKTDPLLLRIVKADYTDAVKQYKLLAARISEGRFPKTYYAASDSLETSDSGWWCSGFYPGTLLYLYDKTKDHDLLKAANRALGYLSKEQYNKSTHDLGFMMYCSFGNALKIEPSVEYKNILINSAKSLSTRFNPKVGAIKSWDSKNKDYLVIIDNMMNLELLFWATRVTGDSSFYKIAVKHANTTMKNHFRSDYSSYHVINYDSQTGSVKQKKTAQGYADRSAWARGQAWGLYGYTVLYRETGNKIYLNQAEHIAKFILGNPNLPADKIPYWDYDAPGKPNVLRDASAASVMASALLELCKYSNKRRGVLYFKTAELILRNLSKPPYLAPPGTNGGFVLLHSVGNMPNKTEIDVPLTYADYYFIEALGRYSQFQTKK